MVLMPAWGLGKRDMLDTNFLRRYAGRMERQAKAVIVWDTFVGGMVGYAFGAMVAYLHKLLVTVLSLPLMFRLPPLPQGPSLGDYTAMAIGAAFAVLWGIRAMGKADDMRFQAQLALHVLKIYDMDMALKEKMHG